jgi:hypothetical protein
MTADNRLGLYCLPERALTARMPAARPARNPGLPLAAQA